MCIYTSVFECAIITGDREREGSKEGGVKVVIEGYKTPPNN